MTAILYLAAFFLGIIALALLASGWELGLRWMAWSKRHRDAKRRARLR